MHKKIKIYPCFNGIFSRDLRNLYLGFFHYKLIFISAWPIAAGDRYIQQTQEHAHLCPVVCDLAKGYPNQLVAGAYYVNLVAIAHGPLLIKMLGFKIF